MNVEQCRVHTFQAWPSNAPVSPSRIAAAGFYFIGPELKVKCYSCGTEISEWDYGDQVMTRHRTLSPECVFVQNPTTAGNVPLVCPSSQPNGPPRLPVAASPLEGQDVVDETPRRQDPQASIGRWVSETSIYKSEQARLDSFVDWPIPFIVRPEALAATGFYFLRQGDKVACAFCTGVIARWERGDDPKEEHRRHFPACPLLLGLPVGNIPRTGHCSAESLYDPARLSELGIQPHRGPRHSKYSTVESRLKTFERWPASVAQRPTDLAQAGFFHETDDSPGTAQDKVRCFHCDGGLLNWDPTDTPWSEHARWFPTCPFLILVKGQRFVDQVQEMYATDVPVTSPPPPSVVASGDKLTTPRSLPTGLSSSMPSLSNPEQKDGTLCPLNSGATGSLEEENRRLRDARQCKICMDAEIGTVLLPCGHLVACVGCAPSLLDCPVCRVTIKATVRTFLT